MDAKDTLCQVAMLSIRSEDMLAYYTADEFARGRLFSCGSLNRTEARHARACGSPNGNLSAHALHPM